jgi:hypothetical protein
MKTLEEIVKYKSKSIDGRDISRLAVFFTLEQLTEVGFSVKEEFKETYKPEEFNKETVLGRLKSDLSFAFSKALNQRGLSASMMNDVIKMWMWVLEDELADHDDYAYYGLPLLKLVAVKYEFDNPIGDDSGDEEEYDN